MLCCAEPPLRPRVLCHFVLSSPALQCWAAEQLLSSAAVQVLEGTPGMPLELKNIQEEYIERIQPVLCLFTLHDGAVRPACLPNRSGRCHIRVARSKRDLQCKDMISFDSGRSTADALSFVNFRKQPAITTPLAAMPVRLSSLPDELLKLVLQHFPVKQRLSSCCLVNKRLHMHACCSSSSNTSLACTQVRSCGLAMTRTEARRSLYHTNERDHSWTGFSTMAST